MPFLSTFLVFAVVSVLPVAPANAETDSLPGAVPASSAGRLPSTSEQYRSLQQEMAKSRPAVEEARSRSDRLNAQAYDLKRRLIATAARVQGLEEESLRLGADIARLSKDDEVMSASFRRQRAQVAALLAVLERVQHDLPPVMAIRADDALAGAHVSMLLGAGLPRLYGAAAELSRQLDLLRRTRADLVSRREEAVRNATALAGARDSLDQLLATKSQQAGQAGAQYAELASRLQVVADQAANLEALLRKVALLRSTPSTQNLMIVAAPAVSAHQKLQRGTFLRPVTGNMVGGDGEAAGAPRAPGVSFLAPPSAQVVAPADSKVLFAGPYHKTGQVLILQMTGGYDLVLAGLERVDVRMGDQLLAGEPVGRMPRNSAETRLYFELRENGKGVNPAPWLEVELRKATRS
jgi:septal ring factor EnvC (AmiA/AmiB activator)